MRRARALGILLLVTVAAPASLGAQQQAAPPQKREAGAGSEPETGYRLPPDTTTHHSVAIDGREIPYSATAGTVTLRDEEGTPTAEVFYIAYARDGVESPEKRPVTFAYNGGPGSASVWLHMGALGPRRVATSDTSHASPPPYRLEENGSSLLDVTDLVFIDPVGTGYSHTLKDTDGGQFWGVDEDARSVGEFIRRYVDRNDRWNSPRYLLGESYGTTRSAVMLNHLQSEWNMDFNGVALVSAVLNFQTVVPVEGNDLPDPLYLPTYAATAWYHDALPDRPDDLRPFLEEVREFADTEYTTALRAGASLDSDRRARVVDRLHRYTGLDEAYLRRADLRVDQSEFENQLERDEGLVLGRLDTRFTGPVADRLAQRAEYDPQSTAIRSAYATAFRSYVQEELGYRTRHPYELSGDVRPWDWSHGRGFGEMGYPNAAPDLAQAMRQNPDLEVLVLNGYYDLATPFHAAEYTVSHLNIPKELRSNLEMTYYRAGHMMYLHQPSLERMKEDVAGMIRETSGSGS